MNRKEFLLRGAAIIGLAAVPAGLMTACGGAGSELAANACDDLSGVSELERKKREGMNYVAQSPEKDKNCLNCKFWKAPAEAGSCGGCQLFGGPVHPKGYCTSWFTNAS
ncbi:MAG: high-potential iron-sulfur protein [Bernardetiaceae bacterium]